MDSQFCRTYLKNYFNMKILKYIYSHTLLFVYNSGVIFFSQYYCIYCYSTQWVLSTSHYRHYVTAYYAETFKDENRVGFFLFLNISFILFSSKRYIIIFLLLLSSKRYTLMAYNTIYFKFSLPYNNNNNNTKPTNGPATMSSPPNRWRKRCYIIFKRLYEKISRNKLLS